MRRAISLRSHGKIEDCEQSIKLVKELSFALHNSKFSACVILKEHFFHPPFVVSVAVLIINIHKSEAVILEILERLERL